jgi:hypothetical protein
VLYPILIDDAIMPSTSGWVADGRRLRYVGDFAGGKTMTPIRKRLIAQSSTIATDPVSLVVLWRFRHELSLRDLPEMIL